MKILIFTVTAGEGHNSMAKALIEQIRAEAGEAAEIEVVDIFKAYAGKFKFRVIDRGYLLACRYLMGVFNLIFRILQRGDPKKWERSPAQRFVRKETPKILEKIRAFQPDAVVCTHFAPAMAITNLRKTERIPARVCEILFDFVLHPFWECTTGVDVIFTPHECFTRPLIEKGFRPEQILPLGLPVRAAFSRRIPKAEARQKLGLSDRFTVMVMLGGGGMGGSRKILKQLLRVKTPLQILMVNGKDSRSQAQIDRLLARKKTSHQVKNYGFVTEVDLMMEAADCLVGKCGGVSVNESLNKDLPMILIQRLPEQEKQNRIFLTERGAALGVTRQHSLTDLVEQAAQDPALLARLRQGIAAVKKPEACRDIARWIVGEPSSPPETSEEAAGESAPKADISDEPSAQDRT